mmetsp:Transcript_45724/g.106136  ORF Transcript_45724/g.106136 Transcript_45724/m.106136 type:complete len:262 (+) Transcript_45724:2928-3713(+)
MSGVLSLAAQSSSALSTSTSAGASFSYISWAAISAACFCANSCFTAFKGVSFLLASLSLPRNSSIFADTSLRMLSVFICFTELPSLEAMMPKDSLIAFCASIAAFSVSATTCIASSLSSVCSTCAYVITAFSTMSSAAFVLSTTALRAFSKIALSALSASWFCLVARTSCLLVRIFDINVFNCDCVAPSACDGSLRSSAGAVLLASATFLSNSMTFEVCTLRFFSSASSDSSTLKFAVLACSQSTFAAAQACAIIVARVLA